MINVIGCDIDTGEPLDITIDTKEPKFFENNPMSWIKSKDGNSLRCYGPFPGERLVWGSSSGFSSGGVVTKLRYRIPTDNSWSNVDN